MEWEVEEQGHRVLPSAQPLNHSRRRKRRRAVVFCTFHVVPPSSFRRMCLSPRKLETEVYKASREALAPTILNQIQRDGMGREVRGRFRIGNTYTPVVDSC